MASVWLCRPAQPNCVLAHMGLINIIADWVPQLSIKSLTALPQLITLCAINRQLAALSQRFDFARAL